MNHPAYDPLAAAKSAARSITNNAGVQYHQQSISPAAPRPITATDELINRIAQRGGALENLQNRLATLADRVAGQQPCDAVGAGASQGPSSHLIAKLAVIDGALSTIETSMRESIERLEQAV